jgi:DNA-binding GntR family transcriptional regulator
MSFLVDIHTDSSAPALFEVRRILEPAAMTLAARGAKPSDVEHLLGLLAQVHGTTSVDDLVDHDRVFHRYIAELTGNAYLAGLLEMVSSGTLRARVWRGLSEEGSVERNRRPSPARRHTPVDHGTHVRTYARWPGGVCGPGAQCRSARSYRSRFMTLSHAATKSFTNFSRASSLA